MVAALLAVSFTSMIPILTVPLAASVPIGDCSQSVSPAEINAPALLTIVAPPTPASGMFKITVCSDSKFAFAILIHVHFFFSTSSRQISDLSMCAIEQLP